MSGLTKHISPILTIADMEETLEFYTSVLGFNVRMKSESYSIVERDGSTIHFNKADNESVMDAVRGRAEIYIEVTEIRSLWEHVRSFARKYKMRDLFERDYGMIEFHIGDPSGCLVFVGQANVKT